MNHQTIRLLESEPWTMQHSLALAALLLTAFLPAFDYFIVNLACSEIRSELHANAYEVQLVISAYASAYAVALITGGRLGDRYGRKCMMLCGITAFTVASLLCGLAMNTTLLVMGRALQGLSAAMMAPQVLATIRAVFHLNHHTKITALYSFVFSIAAILGQIGGGALMDNNIFGLSWRVIFLINIPITGIAWISTWFFVPENRASVFAKLDLIGVVILSVILGLIVYPLSRGLDEHWPLWVFAIIILVLSPLLFLFIRREGKLKTKGGDPIVDIAIFKQPIILIGLIITFLFYTDSLFFLAFPIFLQSGLHWSATDAGFGLLPFTCGFILGSVITPVVVRYLRNYSLSCGYLFLMTGFVFLAYLLNQEPIQFDAFMVLALLVAGIGHGMVMPSITRVVIGQASSAQAGLISGVFISTLQIGSAFGVAFLGSIFFAVLNHRLELEAYSQSLSIALTVLSFFILVCIALSIKLAGLLKRKR